MYLLKSIHFLKFPETDYQSIESSGGGGGGGGVWPGEVGLTQLSTPKCCLTELLQWVVEGPQPLSGMGDLDTEELLHANKDQEQYYYIQEKVFIGTP